MGLPLPSPAEALVSTYMFAMNTVVSKNSIIDALKKLV